MEEKEQKVKEKLSYYGQEIKRDVGNLVRRTEEPIRCCLQSGLRMMCLFYQHL